MKRLRLLITIIFMMTIFQGIITLAEDVTPPAPTEQVQETTSDVMPAPATESTDLQVDLVQIIIGLLTAFAAGGIVGISGLAIFVDRIRNDSATVTALEKLAESYPPGTRDLLLNISKSVTSIGALGEEVFDGKPVQDKDTPPLDDMPPI